MKKISLTALARQLLAAAGRAPSQRSADTVYGGHDHVLRQTLIALNAGAGLDEHDGPEEATLYVLQGRITLATELHEWNGSPGDLLKLPTERHKVTAHEDSAMLLTVAKYRPTARER